MAIHCGNATAVLGPNAPLTGPSVDAPLTGPSVDAPLTGPSVDVPLTGPSVDASYCYWC